MNFKIIVAVDEDGGIGREGTIPWNIPEDRVHFRTITSSLTKQNKSVIIMGWRTAQSLSQLPLPGRTNIVVYNPTKFTESMRVEGVEYYTSLSAALESVVIRTNIFVIGGADLYNEALCHPLCDGAYITRVSGRYNCDRMIDLKLLNNYILRSSESLQCDTAVVAFEYHHRIIRADHIYATLVRDVLNRGTEHHDRTGTGTLSYFGAMMKFDLSTHFPILTTKRVYWKAVVEELLWFIRGETNTRTLCERGIKIWDANGTREFLDGRGLDYEAGELGPIYGYQWRRWGTTYPEPCENDRPIDQLAWCIDQIKNNPTSRRIIMSAWNPSQIDQMALPPCHVMVQFYVNQRDAKLSLSLYQRSGDMGLGIPFNIASYALLLHMVAHVCGIGVGEFVHQIGDCHIYNDHVDALREQIGRQPRAPPQLKITTMRDSIDQFTAEDFALEYDASPPIRMKMAI